MAYGEGFLPAFAGCGLVVQPLYFDRLSNLHADLAQMSLLREPVKSMRTDH